LSFASAANAIASLIATAIAAHTDSPDPHPQYARQASGAIILPIFDADPAPPATGALLYAFTTGSVTQLRIIDSAGTVTTIGP
jgi:hypothetical protein